MPFLTRGARAVPALLLLWLGPGSLNAAAQAAAGRAARVTVTPGAQYEAGWLHRVFFGDHHRRLWTTPIAVPLLNLRRFAGGLTPIRRGGGLQTKSLRFASADGPQFVFRSVDKDPTAAIPPSLRETLVASIVQDQISAAHPAGGLVVAPLLEAAGVLHAQPQLVVMPDDSALGEFRAEFSGMLGTIEIRPTEGDDDEPGFAGADEIIGTDDLFERLESGPDHRVDTRAFLAARLLDVYLGDWDRHQDQWRWARFGEAPFHWQPIPRDRDQAFAKLDGVLLWIARFNQPQLVGFDDDYPPMRNVTWNARDLDRRLLVDLERPVWDSIAVALQGHLTDSVIRSAVERLPPEFYAIDGEALGRALRGRRDKLRDAAGSFYELLAAYVDVHATDEDESVTIVRRDNAVTVDVSRRDGESRPYYRRRFTPSETKEIRLYLHGGDDRVVVRGDADRTITVRVVGGGGDDVMVDSSRVQKGGAKTRFYDDRGDNTFVTGQSTAVDRRTPSPRPVAEDFAPPPPAGMRPPPPDWGQLRLPAPWSYYDTDIGWFLGGGVVLHKYGFRKLPYQYAARLRAGYATAEQTGRVEFELEVPGLLGGQHFLFDARFSGIDLIRFHGFGNNTEAPESESFYEVRQQQIAVRPGVAFPLSQHTEVHVGPVFKLSRTNPENGTLIDSLRPLGIGTVRQLGAELAVQVDTRDRRGAPSRGVFFRASAAGYPAILSVDSEFGRVSGELASYVTAKIPTEPTLALRVGGEKVWGSYPFYEAAYLGGPETLRGFRKQRFGGDAALYGNAELRLVLTKLFFLLPGEFGIFGLGDVGRVFLAGESSETWHSAVGGGVWFSVLDRASTLSLSVAGSDEETRLYVRAGFLF